MKYPVLFGQKYRRCYAPYIFFIALFLMLSAACKRTTVVQGKITSSATGEGLPGVGIGMAASKSTSHGYSTLDSDGTVTDSNGMYSVQVEGRNADRIHVAIHKDGYVRPKDLFYFGKGVCATLDYELHPYDAYIKVTFKNEADVAKNFHFVVTGPHFEEDRLCAQDGCGPYLTQPHDTQYRIAKIPGGDDVDVIWDTKSVGSINRPHVVTVFCPRNDTTEVIIPF